MLLAVFLAAGLWGQPAVQAQSYAIHSPTPTVDKWVYPFAASGGGTRTTAPTFGAVGTAGMFDDRDGEFFVGFNVSNQVPSGKGAANYVIASAQLTLRLTAGDGDVVVYDPTYDPVKTYDPITGGSINGDDPGRPIELYGAAYRNGFNASTVQENTVYAPPGDFTAEGIRNIYPTDSLGGGVRDVANNVRDNFDPIPFAIGMVAAADLNADGTIMGDVDVVFTLNLANPDVRAYLQRALNEGRVNLLATALTIGSQTGPSSWPEYDTQEFAPVGIPGHLELSVTVVPEPNASNLCILGMSLLACSGHRGGFFGKAARA